ncbi:hypothetical protein ES708_08991 [subsurface metagenome]
MKDLSGIIKYLEAEGFQLFKVTIAGVGCQAKTYLHLDKFDTITVFTFGVYSFPPEDEEEEDDDNEEVKLDDNEEIFAYVSLVTKYGREDALLMIGGYIPFPQWFKKELDKRRGVKSG